MMFKGRVSLNKGWMLVEDPPNIIKAYRSPESFTEGRLLKLGIYSRRNEVRKDQYIICIRQHSINDFMSMIQPFMCDSFSYKLATKRWTRESAVASLHYVNVSSKQGS